MSNKERSDKAVANIEDNIKTLIEENDSYKKEQAIKNILAEREQDKKRIKELEADLYSANEIISDLTDSIPKQKVINEINNLKKMFKATTEGILQEYTVGEIIIKTNTLQELLEGEE